MKNKILYYLDKNENLLDSSFIYEGGEIDLEESLNNYLIANSYSKTDGISIHLQDSDENFSFTEENEYINKDFYYDKKEKIIKNTVIPKKIESTHCLWNDMLNKRNFSENDVFKIYNEDYLYNLKTILKHPEGFEYKWLDLEELILDNYALNKGWDNFFKDPFLNNAAKDKMILAESIIAEGTYWPVICIENPENNNTYIVKEGNHRVGSLKLAKLYDLVSNDFKLFCIIIPSSIMSHNFIELDLCLNNKASVRYPAEIKWGPDIIINKNYQNIVHDYLSLNKKGKFIDNYTILEEVNNRFDLYSHLTFYPLFLRDLLYKYKNIKPLEILKSEENFNNWFKEN